MSCAVAHPCDRDSLLGAIEAARRRLIVPGAGRPGSTHPGGGAANGVDLAGVRIVATEHSHASAAAAVALARAGEVETLMKGSLHTDEIMGEIVSSQTGLRTDRRVSHVFVMDVPAYDRMLLVTDAAINIEPTLAEKADILRNAIDLAHALGIAEPRVAILSAIETVNPDIRSTVEAAALCKMADRGQIGAAARRSARLRQRGQRARRAHQEHPLAGGGARRHPAGAEPRGRQHAREAAALLRGRRQRGHRARRARAGRADEPRRQRAHADRLRGGCETAGTREARGGAAKAPV